MDQPFVRNHPLEGDSLRVHFLQCLLRPSSAVSSPHVRIPDTVVFEHGHPRWLYRVDGDSGDIRRSAAGRDLQSHTLLKFFADRAPKVQGRSIGVVAVLTYSVRNTGLDRDEVAVDYLTHPQLDEFLRFNGDARRRQALLQSVVVPPELCYAAAKVMWARQSSIVRRRMSKRVMNDVQAAPVARFGTFDGPEFLSAEVQCADETKRKLVDACSSIADHIQRAHHLKIATMHLFFALSKTGHPYLLWCGSLFVVDATLPPGTGPTIPPTLIRGPAFVESNGTTPDAELDAALHSATDLSRTLDNPGAHFRGLRAARGRQAQRMTQRHPVSQDEVRGCDTRHIEAAAAEAAVATALAWYEITPAVRAVHGRLGAAEQTALAAAGDLFYAAWSEVQSGRCGTGLRLAIPPLLTDLLGPAGVADLIADAGLNVDTSGSEPVVVVDPPTVDDGDLTRVHPLPKIMDDAGAWIKKRFAEKRRVLRQRCVPALHEAVAVSALSL